MNLTAKQQLKRNVCPACYATPAKTYTVPAVTNEDGTISIPAQPVYGIDPTHEPIDPYMLSRTVPGGTKAWIRDDTADDSDKSVCTVPTGKIRQITLLEITYTSTATVGNRGVIVEIYDIGNVLRTRLIAFGAQAASLVYYYNLGAGLPSVLTGGFQSNGWPGLFLSAGDYIRIRDNNVIDVAADDMTINLNYVEYDV